MSFPARCLPVLLFYRILSLSASPSVLSFWAFSVFSFAFVPAVPELIQRGGSLWLPVSSFLVVVMARRRPAFLVPDCLQWILFVAPFSHVFLSLDSDLTADMMMSAMDFLHVTCCSWPLFRLRARRDQS